jgi:hypothetical protein
MIEHIEQGTLPSGCKAVIALTSWKKRINTVGLTIYNLFETCGPDYHIVLTLAEEEFPKKEQELPRDLVLMNKAGVFEILWCKRNWRSFKKWVFAGIKYPKVPIITADDDCIYTCNYANKLYDIWQHNKTCIITNDGVTKEDLRWPRGPNTLFPNLHKVNYAQLVEMYFAQKFSFVDEDMCFGLLAKKFNIPIIELGDSPYYVFHSQIDPQFSSFEWNYTMVRRKTEDFLRKCITAIKRAGK